MPVRIVTDSTSDIPPEVAQRLDVTVIAQNVHFGTETYKDNVTITPDDFYSMLASSPELPKTSQASPGDFKNTFDELGVDADGIVSIHVSSKISGTYNSAVQGAAMTLAKCPVEVIDSEQASMGLGLIVVAAAEAAHRGAGPRRPAAALCTPRRVGPTCSNDGEGYVLSKGFCNSTPRSSKSLTFRVTTVSRCTVAVAAIMASSIIVSDLLCMSRAHSRKAGASICNTP